MKSCCLLDSYYVVGSVCIKCLPCKCLCILTLKSHNTPLGSVLFSSPNHISQIKKQAREVKQLPQHHTASKVEKPGLDPGFWHLPAYTVNPHHSKHVPGTSSVSIPGNVRNATSQISPHPFIIHSRLRCKGTIFRYEPMSINLPMDRGGTKTLSFSRRDRGLPW